MTEQHKKWLIKAVVALVVGILAVVTWQKYGVHRKDDGLVSGNGRIEAVEIDIAAKTPGRIKDILVEEGDFVTAGQVVALMDTEVLDAQRREAEANLQQAKSAVVTALSQLAQRESEKAAAIAVVAQREAELDVARKRLTRTGTLASRGMIAIQALDDDSAAVQSAQAVFIAAQANAKAADATVATARSQVLGERSKSGAGDD